MSLIQDIRDKYARWAVIAIGLSLLGFIMMDAFAGRTGMFSDSGPGTTLGKVNGKKIEHMAFAQQVQEQEDMARQQGYAIDENQRQQLMASLWEQEVMNVVMEEEYEKLGLTVTDREMRTSLVSNPPDQLRQRYTDENGVFNTAAATQEVNNLLKDPRQKVQIRNFLLMKKYMAMLTNTVHVPQWFLEKKNADNSLIARLSFVNVPYASIPDSSFKISDDEIEDYMEDHEDQYRQKEEIRTVDFVSISAAPTSEDSAAARASLAALRDTFSRVNEGYETFLQANGSMFPFYDGYLSKSAIQNGNKDSILAAPVGVVYGPYLDINQQSGKGLYVMSKVIGMKAWADSASVRHILVATTQRDPQSGQMYPVKDDSAAKRTADSILAQIRAGRPFDSLLQLTDDVGSRDKGGKYDITANGGWAEEFVQYSFDNSPGSMGIVKTMFGYHVMEVLSHKGSAPAYKVAYLTKEIIPSDVTEQYAANLANQFAGESRDLKSFNSNYDKMLRSKAVLKSSATLRPLEYMVPGIQGSARSFVKKVYEEDEGDVIGPERVDDNYIIAVITGVAEPGLPSVKMVRSEIEPLLIRKKKAAQIIKNIGTITTLEAVATKTQQQVQTVDSIRFENPRALGYEPRVLGAAFNPDNKNKVVPKAIEGEQGIYVLRVDNVSTTPVEMSIDNMRQMMESQEKQMLSPNYGGGAVQALKEAASIKDNRHKFY